ncbi:hypothetical protein [Ralstonia sp. 24A2]|uniref:hypothetical protein n=1 Tax=Ralstonia sp. 24A2 TaxID=3447364 RepID=UPI003F69DAC2
MASVGTGSDSAALQKNLAPVDSAWEARSEGSGSHVLLSRDFHESMARRSVISRRLREAVVRRCGLDEKVAACSQAGNPVIPRKTQSPQINKTMRLISLVAALVFCVAQPAMAQADQPSAYVKAGIPSPSRTWMGDDYAQAVSVLKAHAVPLPRFSDPAGAALLNRMTATEHLDRCRDQDSSADARYGTCFVILANVADLVDLYGAAPEARDAKSAPELIALAGYILRIGGVLATLQKDVLLTHQNDGNLTKQQAAGDTKTLRAFFDYAQMLDMKDGLSTADRSVLLRAMSDTLSAYKRLFSANDKQELVHKFATARARFDSAEDLARIDAMILELGGERGQRTLPATAQADRPLSSVTAGMPSPSHVWNGEDYAEAVSVLKSRAAPLPRFSDGDGTAILNRMTATENLAVCHDQSRAGAERYRSCYVILTSVANVLQLYVAALPSDRAVQSAPELAALAAYVLRVRGELAALLNGVHPSDENLAAQKAAADAKTVRAFFDYIKMLDSKDGFSAADRTVMLKAASDTLPAYKSMFSAYDRQELVRKLTTARAKFGGAEDRARIDAMLVELGGDRVVGGEPWKLRGQPEPHVDVQSLRGDATNDLWWTKYARPPINAR